MSMTSFPYGDSMQWQSGYSITTDGATTRITPWDELPESHACACDTLKECVMCGSDADGLVFCAACKEAFHQFRRNYFLRILQEMDEG